MNSRSLAAPVHALILCTCFALVAVHDARADNELQGTSLRCCVLQEAPYAMNDVKVQPTSNGTATLPRDQVLGNWTGLAIDALILLQAKLGFKCSSFVPYTASSDKFAGFTGFVRNLNSCSVAGSSSGCQCDIGIGGWARSSNRFGLVDFVAPFSNEAFRVITRKDLATGSPTSQYFFFKTFTWRVWLAIGAVFLLHVLVTVLDPKFAIGQLTPEPGNYDHTSAAQRIKAWFLKIPVLYKIRHAFFNSAFHLMGQAPHFTSHKKGTKEKMLGMMALFMGVFLLTVFQASVTVQVILSSPSPTFVSVADFESCRIPANKIAVLNNSASQYFWQQAVSRTSCHNEPGAGVPGVVSSFTDGFAEVFNHTSDYFYTLEGHILWTADSRQYCGKLAAVGESFFQNSVSFVLPLGSNLTTLLSVATLQLRELDILKSSTDYVSSRESCPSLTNPTLGWSELGVFFYLAFAAEVIMLIVMLLDRVHIKGATRDPPSLEEFGVGASSRAES